MLSIKMPWGKIKKNVKRGHGELDFMLDALEQALEVLKGNYFKLKYEKPGEDGED